MPFDSCDPFDAAWSAFVAAGRTCGPTPGARRAWLRGRSDYLVWVLRVNGPRVGDRVQAAARRLESTIRPVPPADLHVTVWVAGFACDRVRFDDDVDPAVIGRWRSSLADAPRFRVEVGGINSFTSAPFFDVVDVDGGIAELRRRLGAHHDELRFAPYLPHISVGSYLDSRPVAPLVAALSPLRRLPPLSVAVDAVELCAFDGRVPGAPLRTVHRVELSMAERRTA
ncbi:MAG: 2'-5' RNA ligase family protein [Deltaproteobacteria bacterium]|nr:MAG: 2'-5' RNA ligase family protein [Deltaproteobacteria bacterium]